MSKIFKQDMISIYGLKEVNFIILFLSFCMNLSAQEVMIWQDCVKEAQINHLDLISMRERIKQKEADRNIAMSYIFPQITTQLSNKDAKTNTGEIDTYEYSIKGKQLLFDAGKSFYDITTASYDIKSTYYQYLEESAEVRFNLRVAFINLLKAQNLLSLTEKIVQRRKDNLNLVKLRYEGGREHKGALLTSEANLKEAESDIIQTKRALLLAQKELLKELGRRNFTPIEVKEEFVRENLSDTLPDFSKLAEETPLFKDALALKESFYFNLKSVQADFFPKVSLDSSWGKSSSYWPPQDESWSVGISISLPIFEGGKRIAEVSKAKAQLKEKETQIIRTKDNIIFALEQAWVELQDAWDKVDVQYKYLKALEERAKIASAQYSTGLIAFDDWTIIEDNLVNAQKSYLEAQMQALIKQAQWDYVRGRTLDEE